MLGYWDTGILGSWILVTGYWLLGYWYIGDWDTEAREVGATATEVEDSVEVATRY